jgi:hypothetical protein
MSATSARFALCGLVLVVVLGLSPLSTPSARRVPSPGAGDPMLHLATIERVRNGESYYVATGKELRDRHYPATRVFNWRTPVHPVLVAALSVPVARGLLAALALVALILTPLALREESKPVLFFAAAAQLGAIGSGFIPLSVSVAEVWSGVLIALSLIAYYRRQWIAGAALGVGAVFFRELAAPYALVCGLLALHARRRGEGWIWVAGGLAYAAYFWLHATNVWAHQLPGDLAQGADWLRWNGLAFTLTTVKVNGVLARAPQAAAAIYLAIAFAAIAASSTPPQVFLPLLGYCLLFAFAGHPFNYYWGYVTAPLWAFSAAHGLTGITSLVAAARGSAVHVEAQP